jgi:hypothetical protein
MNFLERAKLYLGAKPIKKPKHSNLKFDPLLLVFSMFLRKFDGFTPK